MRETTDDGKRQQPLTKVDSTTASMNDSNSTERQQQLEQLEGNNHGGADESEQQLEEYQQQLAEIDELLVASPGDPSLLALKADLLELISVVVGADDGAVAETIAETTEEDKISGGVKAGNDDRRDSEATEDEDVAQISAWSTVVPKTPASASSKPSLKRPAEEETDASDAVSQAHESTKTAEIGETANPPLKKAKKSSLSADFVVPSHLKPNPEDSVGEANRKKRAVKALKNQWRSQRKEHEANKKQKSWQDFQKKGKSKQTSSIFATSNDEGKVGVVGGRHMTNFASRKRHK